MTSLGPVAGYTTNYGLALVNFNWTTWHDYEWQNWETVDALLEVAIGFLNIRGVWKPLTDYIVGESVIDPNDNTVLWKARNTHTSSTLFDAAEIAAHWDPYTSSAGVTSVFGRGGAVVAEAGDYDAFYYTEAEIDALIANYYTQAQVDASQAIQDGNISSNTGDIATNTGAISALDGRVTTNEADIATHTGQLATHAGQIATNEADILTNAGNITANAGAISTNTTNIGTNTTDIATNETNANSRARYLGAWSAGTYNENDMVTDGGYLFIVTASSTTEQPDNGNTPPDPTDWDLIGNVEGGGEVTRVLLAEEEVTGSVEQFIDFTSIAAIYDRLELHSVESAPDNGGRDLQLQVSYDNGTSWSTNFRAGATNNDWAVIASNVANNFTRSAKGRWHIIGYADAADYTFVVPIETYYRDASGDVVGAHPVAGDLTEDTVDAIRLLYNDGGHNHAIGCIYRLYGVLETI